MRALYNINVLNVKVFLQIIVILTFISTTIFAHPHSSIALEAHPHTHPQNKNDLIDDPDQFKDLDLQSSNPSSDNNSIQNQEKKKLILFDDNFYLLDNDFDFGTDEIELQKMEINKDDLETAKEYENFLNAFFEESNYIGSKTSNSKSNNNGSFDRLRSDVKALESEKRTLNKKIDNLEKQLRKNNKNSGEVNDFEFEKRLLNQKIENLEKQLKSESKEVPKPNRNTANSSNKSGFGVSIALGATIPIFQTGFGLGGNGGVRLETPASFNLAGMDCKVGAEFYGAMMLPKDSTTYKLTDPITSDQRDTTIINDKLYSLMNIVGNISMSPSFIPSLEIRPGLGLTLTKIGEDTKTTLSIPLNLIYFFPMDLSGFKIGFNLLSQVTFGHPTLDGTTSHINVGLVIKTPIRF